MSPKPKKRRKRWTDDDIEILRQMYKNHTAAEMAEYFDVTEKAIHLKCHEQRILKCPNRISALNDQERYWFIRNYPHIRDEIISLRLNMSLKTIYTLSRQLGLRKTPEFIKETNAIAGRIRGERLKGVYSPNLQKGEPFQLRKGEYFTRDGKRMSKNTGSAC